MGREKGKIWEDLFSVFSLFDQWKQNTGGVANQKSYLNIMDMYAPVLAKLTPETGEKLLRGNYERLFDAAKTKVRAWEKLHANDSDKVPVPAPVSGVGNHQ